MSFEKDVYGRPDARTTDDGQNVITNAHLVIMWQGELTKKNTIYVKYGAELFIELQTYLKVFYHMKTKIQVSI